VANCCDCFCARLPLDEKLFERDLQAALQLSNRSTEGDNDVKTGLMNNDNIVVFVYVAHVSYFTHARMHACMHACIARTHALCGKNRSLPIMLMATDQKLQNHKKVMLLSITLTLRQCVDL